MQKNFTMQFFKFNNFKKKLYKKLIILKILIIIK